MGGGTGTGGSAVKLDGAGQILGYLEQSIEDGLPVDDASVIRTLEGINLDKHNLSIIKSIRDVAAEGAETFSRAAQKNIEDSSDARSYDAVKAKADYLLEGRVA